jgi:aryl-alcohol dehydrogenase-like predicted oxidoreductase
MVSDISLGSGGIEDIKVAIRAIERGVNYFDTAPDYSQNGFELLFGQAIPRDRRARQDVPRD